MFAVAVPYYDAEIVKYIGPARWNQRELCEILQVPAVDSATAVKDALKAFKDSPHDHQGFSGREKADEVSILNEQIVAERR